MTFFDLLPLELVNKLNTYKAPQFIEEYQHVRKGTASKFRTTLTIIREDSRYSVVLQLDKDKKNKTLEKFLLNFDAGKDAEMSLSWIRNEIAQYLKYRNGNLVVFSSDGEFKTPILYLNIDMARVIQWLRKVHSGDFVFTVKEFPS
jgi:hypothetical protein